MAKMGTAGNYYDILGIDKNASKEDIKSAYRRLALRYHPDRNPGNKEAEERFKKINEAYAVLNDDKKRREYEMWGGTRFGQTYKQEDIFREFDFGSIKDVFNGFAGDFGLRDFRDLFPNFGQGQGKTTYKVVIDENGKKFCRKGRCMGDIFTSLFETGGMEKIHKSPKHERRDVYLDMPLTWKERYFGTEKRITVKSRGKVIHVKIPAGVKEGTKIRLKGEGREGGDLYLIVWGKGPF